MPRATVGDAPDLYPLPEQTVFDGQLLACEAINVPFTYKKGPREGQPGSFDKWEWTFVVNAPGQEYDGLEVKGSTEPRITDATETDGFLMLARPWVEALLGRPIQVGEDVDTDDLLALPCKFTVRHEPKRARKQGDGFWYNVAVDEVFAAGDASPELSPRAAATVAAGGPDPWAAPGYDEPPF
jgi:hypothetical protein